MEFRKVGVTFVLAVAAGMLAAGCPGGAGTVGQACTDNLSCSEGEICHPTVHVCAQTCTAPGDCSSGACNAVSGTSNSVCGCGNDDDCRSYGSDFTCVSGVCAASGAGNPDAGTGGGGACDPSATTIGSNGGPSTCAYGQICDATTSQCMDAPVGNCTEATAAGAPTWNKTAGTAPVIVSATAQSISATSSQCNPAGPAAVVTIQFYDPQGFTSHSDFADLQNHVKFRTGTQFFGANFPSQNPPANATTGTLKVGIACGQASPGRAAIYLQDEQGNTGNVVCVTW